MALTFGEDIAFLKRFYPPLVLSNDEGAKLVCVAELQGRTMTSTASGDGGTSNGYINYDVFEQGMSNPQINLFGGEDRIWISPEGGQYSVFFKPGDEMSFANWRTPPCVDSESFELTQQNDRSLTFAKTASVTNMSGFTFCFSLQRTVLLLSRDEVATSLDVELPDTVSVVGHRSDNMITNTSDDAWQQETGLIGLWTICMNPPADNAVVMVPFKTEGTTDPANAVTADYFGELGADRLKVDVNSGTVFLRGDGNFRSKVGVAFPHACNRMGSWNPESGVFSVVSFNLPSKAIDGYTNNLWKVQDDPFSGDAVNAYNDGPNDSGGKFGGFFELETISPALSLVPGESFTHSPQTVRLQGPRGELDAIAKRLFNVTLDEIESALAPLA